MYNKTLNSLFNFFSCLDKSKALKVSKAFASPKGVQQNLLSRLARQEEFRMRISRGQIKEEFAKDPIEAAFARIEANYQAGLIDEGKYKTQIHKIKSLKNMRFAEKYNNLVLDKENLNYYKLKYAAQLSDNSYRTAYDYYENQKQTKEGAFYGVYRKSDGFFITRDKIL